MCLYARVCVCVCQTCAVHASGSLFICPLVVTFTRHTSLLARTCTSKGCYAALHSCVCIVRCHIFLPVALERLLLPLKNCYLAPLAPALRVIRIYVHICTSLVTARQISTVSVVGGLSQWPVSLEGTPRLHAAAHVVASPLPYCAAGSKNTIDCTSATRTFPPAGPQNGAVASPTPSSPLVGLNLLAYNRQRTGRRVGNNIRKRCSSFSSGLLFFPPWLPSFFRYSIVETSLPSLFSTRSTASLHHSCEICRWLPMFLRI
jgi:hypothetical protein